MTGFFNGGIKCGHLRRPHGILVKESDDVGKSLAADVNRAAKTWANFGQGDKSDEKLRKGKERARFQRRDAARQTQSSFPLGILVRTLALK